MWHFRLILVSILALIVFGFLSCWWVTLLILYALSWFVLWDQIKPRRIYEHRYRNNDVVEEILIYGDPWWLPVLKFIFAPLILIWLLVIFFMMGGVPFM